MSQFMIKVRPANAVREIIEIPNTVLARAVDSMVYLETKEILYLGSSVARPLDTFGSFAFVELETGFEEVAGETTVVYVDPNNQHLVAKRRTMWPGDTGLFINHGRASH